MNQDQPKIPGSGDPTPDTAPILLENLDVPQPNSNICPWGIARIPICARWEDADDSKDILPAMGFISDFHDIVHWNRCTSIIYVAPDVSYESFRTELREISGYADYTFELYR